MPEPAAAVRQSATGSAPGCAAANASARAASRSQQTANWEPPSDRARFDPIRPQPMIATLRGIRSTPVRITQLCDVSLILPAFNEAGTIAATILETGRYFRARGLRYEIIVAADGDDGTRELALEPARRGQPVRVIGNRQRSGKGRGVREAVALAQGKIVGYADADNKVPIEEFDKMRPCFSRGYDVVI